MSMARIAASRLQGVVAAPPSKSAAHRALIAAALSGNSRIEGIIPSMDMEATLRCLCALGYTFTRDGDTVTFHGRTAEICAVADCGESGSTARFFVPIMAALGVRMTLVGGGRLPARPMTVYETCLPPHGVTLTRPDCDGGILHIEGTLRGGRYEVAGDVSSQFITGLLMALPLCREDSEIVLTSPLQSAGYVAMTLEILRLAGITVETTENGWRVAGGQTYALSRHTVEGDWSQAAFLLTAGAVGGDVTVTNLRRDSVQGDKRIEELLSQMGADIAWTEKGLRCRQSALRAVRTDVSDIPDLVPILSVAASAASGTSRWLNASRLRIKESDRLQTTQAMLTALGGKAEILPTDDFEITGSTLVGGTVSGENDHRIVMSAAVASLMTDDAVTVSDAHSIAKSWPTFFEMFRELGGDVREF